MIHDKVVAALLAAIALLAGTTARAEPLLPEKAVELRRVVDPRFSPDGSQLVYAVLAYEGEETVGRLWLADVRTGRVRRLTTSMTSETAPAWSPDGKSVAFLSIERGRRQVKIVGADGGAEKVVTAHGSGVTSFSWSPDSRRIAYLARGERPGDGNSPRLLDQQEDLLRVWIVDAANGSAVQLTRGAWRVDELQWLDRERLVAIASDKPHVEAFFNGALYSISVNDGSYRLLSRPPLPLERLTVSPGGRVFAFAASRADGPVPHDLFVQEADAAASRNVTAVIDRDMAEARWQSDSVIWARAIDGFRNRLVELRPGKPARFADVSMTVGPFDVSRDGRLAFVGSRFDRLPELYLRDKKGAIRQLSHVQTWNGAGLVPAEIFRTRSFDGLQIEAALMKGQGGMPGRKRPLVLLVHGGPAANFSATFSLNYPGWAPLLASRGYDVLMVNPRGSNGYGEAFIKANRADWGGGDYRDLLAVLDAVVARGETDANRLGIAGWSYGGEMTAWAIGHTDRFRAAVIGAPVVNQQAEFGTQDGAATDQWYLGTPWANPDVFTRVSPMTFVKNVRTPTLLLHGDADPVNPVGQSLEFYRALKAIGVETRLVLYPGEPHSLRRRGNQIDAFRRVLDWFDSHL